MTITEIISLIRGVNDDNSGTLKYQDSYYTDKIILALGDLEAYLGKIATRTNKYQFIAMRDGSKQIIFDTDGVTPKIDEEIYYNPDNPSVNDSHVPLNAIINQGLSVKTGADFALLETADFYDDLGIAVTENDIAFIKVLVIASDRAEYTVDVSVDGRETWLVEDYGRTLDFDNNSTGYVDVSDVPSSRVSLRWKVTAGTIKATAFDRYYIPEQLLRNYAHRIVELAYARILDIDLKKAIQNQNDPLVINGIRAQIDSLRTRNGINPKGGSVKRTQGGTSAAIYFPDSKEENELFGYKTSSPNLLADGRTIGITNNGQIRRI